jgi:hypothetical protein
MPMNEQKIKGMLWGAIIGDTIGTPFDGLTKAHIHSIFKSIDNYTDTSPALKGRPETWKKPGLYSAASQLMILMSMFAISNKRPDPRAFIRLISKTPGSAEDEYGIFRHPTIMVKHLIYTEKTAHGSSESAFFSSVDASTAVILIPLILSTLNTEAQLEQILSFSLMFNKDIHSTSGTLIFNVLLKRILSEKNSFIPENIFDHAIEAAKYLLEKINNLAPKIFDLGLNPDYLLSSVRDYLNIFLKIINIKNIDSAEKNIFIYVNTKIKTPVTRATVNHPMAIIPFSMYLSRYYSNSPSETFFRTVEYGGSASILGSLTGALNGAMFGFDRLPVNLLNELVNKKRITSIVDSVFKEKITEEIIQDFISGEASLSAKETEEKNAKLKHVKIKIKKKKSRHEMEKELSNHVVESWTKFDKAKWRRKLDREQEN